MLSGFNTNVRHRRVLFHVQTEDSGRARPHIITHLYHGGTILASEKRGYSEHLEASDLEARVRGLMDAQHRAMVEQLRRGKLDQVIRERLGADVFPDAVEARQERPVTPEEAPEDVAASPEAPPEGPDGAPGEFGEGFVSEKPLDEVILSYLVENARKRKRSRQ